MTASGQRPVPRATYRLQFSSDFRFRDAAALAPYIAALGVSHVYASPFLRARGGSSHGYDIVDHCALNPELGSAEDFEAMASAFAAHGLGQILDFVPNHMGVGGADNRWWLDVLEWGPASLFSGWFDIDWAPSSPLLAGRVLMPFLGEQYGTVLAAGGLRLKFDAEAGTLAVWAYDTHKMPLTPATYGRVLGTRHPVLARLGDAFAHLDGWHPHQQRRADALEAELARAAGDPEVAAALASALARFEGTEGDLESWSRLDALIREQHWRPAHFRVAADEINYRRFFNISDLAGIRMEHEELFDHAHGFVFDLLDRGLLDGLRIDHVDGLFDPKRYCLRLREKAPRPFYLLVEKILAPHERLRGDWDTEGTTGYEFANLVTGLMIDPAGTDRIESCYREFTGETATFAAIVEASKRRIIADEMASELGVLARDAARIAASDPRSVDFTTNVLRRALAEVVVAFPVYRTYVDGGPLAPSDRRDIDWAFAAARRAEPGLHPSVFEFLHRLVTTDILDGDGAYSRHDVVRFAMRFQQYCGPVMAKGLEDTAFYRYNRFLAANEVGGHPQHLGVSIAAFHEENLKRARETPAALLSTSTHDTKRGEDTRARLALLAELAEEWSTFVTASSRVLRAREAGAADPSPPSRSDEYAFYQLVVGAWPPGLAADDEAGVGIFRDRIQAAMLKAMREAKLATNWAAPDAAYEEAVAAFIDRALGGARSNPFLESAATFAGRLHALGAANSLVQLVLKLTVPGVPDIYRGAEMWDFSLVDPDNRRPVDFAERERLLEAIDPAAPPVAGDADLGDGRAKLALTAALLRHRALVPELYRDGAYLPLAVSGAADAVVAFARRIGDRALVVAARRFPSRPLDAAGLACPEPVAAAGGWRDLVTGAIVTAEAGELPLGPLLSRLPVAVLWGDAAQQGSE